MSKMLFKPRSYTIRTPDMTGRRHGRTINAPRIPEIGGAGLNKLDSREPELTLKKPGGTS